MENFGGNLHWEPRAYRPRSEREVLDILAQHREGSIRAIGAGHSWSEVAVSDVCLDLCAFDALELREAANGDLVVRAGAGCRLQALLDGIRGCNRTLPTLGVIKLQTVSGAISTGTHGSGKQSLSHFVVGVRLAAYDAQGRPQIRQYDQGPELEALRCGLGCAGILLSVDLRTVPRYAVEETIVKRAALADVQSALAQWPLTQFALFPYEWRYLLFKRAERPLQRRPLGERLKAWLLRIYNKYWVDIGFHLLVKTSVALGACAVKSLQRHAQCLTLAYTRLDDSEQVLTLHHYYFQHEEMELFVPESHLSDAMALLRLATEVFSGNYFAKDAALEARLRASGLFGALEAHCGRYTHHYPYSMRRLLPEGGLIAMGSGSDTAWFSISVFTYLPPEARGGYYSFCAWLARAMHRLFGARLHWGKHFPLGPAEVETMYGKSALEGFRDICRAHDTRGVFINDYARRLLF